MDFDFKTEYYKLYQFRDRNGRVFINLQPKMIKAFFFEFKEQLEIEMLK